MAAHRAAAEGSRWLLDTAGHLASQELGAEKQLPAGPDARTATGCHDSTCPELPCGSGVLERGAHQIQAEAYFLLMLPGRKIPGCSSC